MASGVAATPAAACSRLRTPGGGCTTSTLVGAAALSRSPLAVDETVWAGLADVPRSMSAMAEFSLASRGLLAAKLRTLPTFCDTVA